jgi:soluble lytic murein transglycosylase
LVKVFYPIYHQDIIVRYSQQYDVDPYLISAIIRVESKFYHKAESHKGARGLMQISQVTGDWAASELGIENYDRDMLFEPEINIMIGCWYIHTLKKEFGNNIETVIAAYNGGSGNVSRWLMDGQYSSDGTTLTNIPFQETREYVKRVLKDYRIYRKLYS